TGTTDSLVLDLTAVGRDDVARVGGKNASLGEMLRHLGKRGVNVPDGFATTAEAYRLFVRVNGLEEIIRSALADLKAGRAEPSDVKTPSLGETFRHLGKRGVNVPDGFATTPEAYRLFVRVNGLEEIIRSALDDLEAGRAELSDVGRRIREAMLRGEWPEALAD